jgi:cell division protein FtsQ
MATLEGPQKVNWTWGVKLLLLIVLAMAGVIGWQAIQPWMQRPLQQIILQTDIPAAEKVALQAQLNTHLSDSFFGADLQLIRQEVESHPWVNDAKVSRIWPNRLMVEAPQQIFMARWKGGGLINHLGELVFVEPHQAAGFEGLPTLSGPKGNAWAMSELYREMSWLVGRDDLTIDDLTMAQRGAVELRLHNGIILLLGRDQVLPRLQRLMKVYHSHFVAKAKTIERIDGRYPYGVSVAWKKVD